MNTKNNILLFFLLNFSFFSCQNTAKEYKLVEGVWKGYFNEGNKKYTANLEILKNNEIENSYHFILTNSTQDKFLITKSKIIENPTNTLEIKIEKASLSSCEKCQFTKGKVIIKIIDNTTIDLSVFSVGPSYWRTYDVEEGMTDFSNLVLKKAN